ncbi:hypothetical protein [Frankia gtarii]|uniref:hypothetical protein n=1 Tax=Frankia gtarii TaxID=2950102 RepID=UPI0021BE807D|nr:hypothetical protein [Frankia gtarii]
MTLNKTEATRLFEQSYQALMSYRYLGKVNPHLDRGVTRETMPLRRDMRNSAGGIMAAPLCVLAVEPWWLDYQGIAAMVAPVTMTYSVLDAAHGVTRLECRREVLAVGRRMGFSRSVVVDADDPGRLIAMTTGSGFDLGVVPDGFEPIDNPVDEFDDEMVLPPLHEAFGGHLDVDGSVVITELSPALGAPNRSLHQAPINVIAEAAAMAGLQRMTGTADFQVHHWTVQFIKPGSVGPFRARATVRPSRDGRWYGVDVDVDAEGQDRRLIATISALFSHAGGAG